MSTKPGTLTAEQAVNMLYDGKVIHVHEPYFQTPVVVEMAPFIGVTREIRVYIATAFLMGWSITEEPQQMGEPGSVPAAVSESEAAAVLPLSE